MKLLKSTRTARRLAFPLALLAALLPGSAMAAEGDVKLNFTSSDQIYLWISFGLGVLALLYGFYLARGVNRQSPGSEKMQAVGLAIREGAMAYLRKQITAMAPFVLLLAIGLFFLYRHVGSMTAVLVAVAFIGGVFASYIAGYAGMRMAVAGNMRTANAALTSYKRSLEVAFRSGAVAGMVTVGMGLIGASLILIFAGEGAMRLLIGFGFGGSLAALFMRVGGGIFTKAADVGADLVGKVEAGIPEDDPRNPATIADNVGDNVGDCAGMAADVFESYEVTLVAAIVLGAATAAIFDQATVTRLIIFALMARGVGILASIIGVATVRGSDDLNSDPLRAISGGFYRSAFVAILGTGLLSYLMMGGNPSVAPPITATQLHPMSAAQREDVQTIQRVRREKAAAAKKQEWQISAKELLTDPRVKALGFKEEEEQMVAQFLQAPAGAEPTDLSGYRRITNFNDPDIPALKYAVSAPPPQPGAPAPTSQFTTLGAVVGGQGKERLIAAQIRIKETQPPQPPTAGEPAKAAKTVERTFWYGPTRESDLDRELEQQKKSAQGNPNAPSVEVLERRPMQVYVGPDNKIALAVSDENLQRPYTISAQNNPQLGGYYPTDPATLEALVKQTQTQTPPGGAVPQFPPLQPIEVATVTSSPVPWWTFFLAITFGIVMAFAIERLTDYYVSTHKKPTQEVAGVSTAGPAPMIIQGFAYASESSVFMVFAIVIALLFPLFLFPATVYGSLILSFYGIALVGLGLLTTTGYVLAMDTFGPISDNAQGVYEMSGEGHDNVNGAKAVQRLDAAGNTTKALTKGFAIATAVVAAVALFHSYIEDARLSGRGLPLDVPEIFLGLLIGGAAPYLFSAFAINAVGRSSFELINEVRRQFRSDPGIMAGTSKPDYARCVAIVTAAAQKELLGPGILAIALPAAVGFGFSIGKAPVEINGQFYNLTGAQALGGFLAGAILSGQLLAVLLANSGGMWDNAKKLVEDGLYGGKGSEAHKAAVVCDTVGDPFKDTAGPALNPLIKVMNLVALLLAGTIIQPLGNNVLITITLIALAALAFSIFLSKKGSLSKEMQRAQTSGEAADASLSLAPGTPESRSAKRRITVEEPIEPPINGTDPAPSHATHEMPEPPDNQR